MKKNKSRIQRPFLLLLIIISFITGIAMTCCIPCFASQPQVELSLAKACYFYDTGNLSESFKEFKSVLSKNPKNKTASIYIDKIISRIEAIYLSQLQTPEKLLGRRNALIARKKTEMSGREKYVSCPQEPYQRFINTTGVGYNERKFDGAMDRSFYPDGLFAEEHLRMDTNIQDWQNALSMNIRHRENGSEDTRIRRLTYSVSGPAGPYFIAGDTSTRLSRYTLKGVYYRGVNFSLCTEKNKFKVLFGAPPYFKARTLEKPNIDTGYIYPRRIFGIRDAYNPVENYQVGISFMELRDYEKIRSINDSYNPKLNRVVSVDQDIEIIHGRWKIQTENAYATSDEDRTDEDIFTLEKELKDTAHYIRSSYQTPKFRLINSFERIGADFRSYGNISSTGARLSAISSNKEKLDHYLECKPFEDGQVYLNFHFSRIRNNLDKDNDIETNRLTAYETTARFIPKDCCWIPESAVRLNISNTLLIPGSLYASDEVSDRDIIFELAKKIYGIDLGISYTRRNTLDNIDTFKTYSNIYSIRAAKELTDLIMLSTDYRHSNAHKKENGEPGMVGREDFFNINAALRLWAGADLSLGYAYENDTDATGICGDTKMRTYSLIFSWPFNKIFLDNGTELMLIPYFSYQYGDGRTSENKNRSILSAVFDATYAIAKNHRISLKASYRDDINRYYDPDTDNSTTQTEDRRLLLTYQKIFG